MCPKPPRPSTNWKRVLRYDVDPVIVLTLEFDMIFGGNFTQQTKETQHCLYFCDINFFQILLQISTHFFFDIWQADGFIVKHITLLANPNQVRPTRFWGVYTKLKIFNMTTYRKGMVGWHFFYSFMIIFIFVSYLFGLIRYMLFWFNFTLLFFIIVTQHVSHSLLFSSCLSRRRHRCGEKYRGSFQLWKVLCKLETFWENEFWSNGCWAIWNSFQGYDVQSWQLTFLHGR